MNPYQFSVYCDICGESGVATSKVAASAWIKGNIISHDDPRVCAENIAYRKRQEEIRKEKENIMMDGVGI